MKQPTIQAITNGNPAAYPKAEPLVTKRELAPVIGRSPRTIDNDIAARRYPFIRLSPRCVRFRVSDVLAALAKYEVAEVGRPKTSAV